MSFTSTKRTPPSAQLSRHLEQSERRAAERRVELHGDDELLLAERPGERRLALLLAERLDQLALGELELRPWLARLLHRCADRRDLGRGRPTTAADHAGAQFASVGGELGEVLGCGVRVDDTTAGEAREADVRERGERYAAAHLLERLERDQQPAAVVGADRGDIELPQAIRGFACVNARQGLRTVVERHQRHDRQRRDHPHRADRVDQLLQVVERLDHEQVGATAFENARLLAVQLLPHPRRRRFAERADRAGNEDVATGDLTCFAGQLDRGRVDPLELVLEEMVRQLAPVSPERIGLDQLRAGVDEADVQRDDRLGRAKVRLLG